MFVESAFQRDYTGGAQMPEARTAGHTTRVKIQLIPRVNSIWDSWNISRYIKSKNGTKGSNETHIWFVDVVDGKLTVCVSRGVDPPERPEEEKIR